MKYLITFLFTITFVFSFSQEFNKKQKSIVLDSLLFSIIINDSIVRGYFHLNSYDSIFIIKSQYTSKIENSNFLTNFGKPIIFITREKTHTFSPIMRNISLEFLEITKSKNKIFISIGKNVNWRVRLLIKKKKMSYSVISQLVT